MGFFQFGSLSFTGKTTILGADVQMSEKDVEAEIYTYSEMALHIVMRRN